MNSDSLQLLNMSLRELQDWALASGEPTYRARQIIQWIHQRGVRRIEAMTDLSKAVREKLQRLAVMDVPQVIREQVSSDGTRKWLLRLADGAAIETVFIPQRQRGTLCVSSQVGCALNCRFCSTGKEGFSRNLSLAEIIGQVWLAVHQLLVNPTWPVTNVVMMGMGEPLLNYQPVVDAMELMMSDYAYGLSKYRVTLSTAGVVPALYQLREESSVSVAISLHAAHDELRNQLVPLNKKYPLSSLLAACRHYFPAGSKRRITFEYVLLDGVNDRLADAQQLVHLLQDIPCKINLIPFNPFPNAPYRRSSEAAIAQFQHTLMKAHFNVRVRRTRGEDVEGACGQLIGQFLDRTGRQQRWLRKISHEVVSHP